MPPEGDPMRVLITSTTGSGHLNPLLPYARALAAAGHSVAVAVPPGAAARLAEVGVAHLPVGEPSGAETEALRRSIDAATGTLAVRAAGAEFFAGLARAALPDLLRHVADWRPDLVLRESAEFAGSVAAEATGLPSARVGVHGGHFEMDVFPHLVAPIDHLRTGIGLGADDGAGLRSEPVFSAFPAFMDEGVDWAGTREPFRVRPSADAAPARGGPRPPWAPAEGETFVYVTLGTVSGRSEKSRSAYRAVLEALATLPVRALLTTGPVMPHGELGTVPPNVTVETFVPQAEVLPLADAVICHGGSGTLLGALAHGLPQVVVPLFADQPHNAAAIERAGAGLSVTDLSAPVLRAAIARVLEDAGLRQTARRIGGEIAGMPGMDVAVERLLALSRRASVA
jgi:UDP:flavonoid glycosyltransferase YjiC (YdhE family)